MHWRLSIADLGPTNHGYPTQWLLNDTHNRPWNIESSFSLSCELYSMSGIMPSSHHQLMNFNLFSYHDPSLVLVFIAQNFLVTGIGWSRSILRDGRNSCGAVLEVVLSGRSDFRYEAGHGHFNIQFDQVCDGVELHEYKLIMEEHETDDHELFVGAKVSVRHQTKIRGKKQNASEMRLMKGTYIHWYRDDHEIRVVCHKWLVFL